MDSTFSVGMRLMSYVFITPVNNPKILSLPYFDAGLPAGFPSPAADYVEQRLDLNELCITHPNATYYAKVDGESMTGAGIFSGDILVVDRAIEPEAGNIVVMAVDGEFTVKELQLDPPRLLAHHPDYPPIMLSDASLAELFGVVTWVFRATR